MLDENKILQLREDIEDKICYILCENEMCQCQQGDTCTQCINAILKILVKD